MPDPIASNTPKRAAAHTYQELASACIRSPNNIASLLAGSSQEERFEIAKIAAAQDEVGTVSEFIQSYGIKSEESLVAIAKITAVENGLSTSLYIQNYGIKSEESLVAIAKIAAQNDHSTSDFIQNYGIKSEESLIAIAKIAAAKFGSSLSELIQNYGIKDEDTLVAIAKIAAAQDGKGTSLYIQKYGIKSEESLVAIAKIVAAQDGRIISQFIQRYGIKSEESLVAIAKIAAAQDGRGISQFIVDYGIKSEESLVAISKIAAAQDGEGTIEYIGNYNFEDAKILLEILVIGINQSAAAFSAFHKKLCPPWKEKPDEVREVVEFVRSIDSKYGDRLLDCLTEVNGQETLPKALALTIKHWDSLDHNSNRNLAYQALEKEAGIELPVKGLSGDSRRKLYETIFAANTPLTEQVAVSQDAWEKRFNEALDCISYLSALNALGGKYSKVELNAANVVEKKALIEDALSIRFAEVIGLESGVGNVGKLVKQWGDLTPITVLAGRYQAGNQTWKNELPVLREICQKVLDGTFHDWKYDKEQLSMLNETQLAKWRENPSSLRIHKVSAERQENPVEYAKTIFQRNLLAHVTPQVLLAYRQTKVTDDLIDTQESKFAKSHTLASTIAVINHLLESGETEKLLSFISKFNSAKKELLNGIPDAEAKQISNDIKSIQDAVRVKKVEEGKQYGVFSIVADAPKLLLTIGDLVNTASCQNYRTGTHIQTLPAYVMDGNIKACLSFPIAMARIQAIFGKDIRQEDLSYEFNPAKLQLTLKANGKEEMIELGKATRRSILRLGATESKKPGLFIEDPYLQTHAVMPFIAEQEAELIAIVRQGIGAEQSGKINFPESRNPAGVYSDAAGGIKIGEYSIG